MPRKLFIKSLSRMAVYQLKSLYKLLEEMIVGKKHIDFESLMTAKKPKDPANHKLIFCFNPGRSGTRWLSNVFNAHENWVGTCERFGQYESFVRYCAWHNLNIDLEGAFKLFEQAIYKDFKKKQNSMIVSPFFNFIIPKMVKRYKPNYVFFVYRNPIDTVCSLHAKGLYSGKTFSSDNSLKKATITVSPALEIRSLSDTFAYILPKGRHSTLREWESLTRIGKCTWFWVVQMKALQKAYFDIKNTRKKVYRLEEMDQNYPFYEKLVKEHNLRPKMSKKEFLSLKKLTHPENEKIHSYKNWSDKERKEFKKIIREANLKLPFNNFRH